MPTLYAEDVGMHQGSVPEVEAKDWIVSKDGSFLDRTKDRVLQDF